MYLWQSSVWFQAQYFTPPLAWVYDFKDTLLLTWFDFNPSKDK